MFTGLNEVGRTRQFLLSSQNKELKKFQVRGDLTLSGPKIENQNAYRAMKVIKGKKV